MRLKTKIEEREVMKNNVIYLYYCRSSKYNGMDREIRNQSIYSYI